MIRRTAVELLFWALPISKVVQVLQTDTQVGLSESGSGKRIKIFGPGQER